MGVSLYVMPIGRYLTRRFKTTWETRSELAGGGPGFHLTPDGARPGPPESVGLNAAQADLWLERFRAALRERYVEPAWDEQADVLLATTMSYGSFGRLAGLAGRFAGRMRFVHLVDPLCPYWIPCRFPRPLEIRDPAGEDEPIKVLSSMDIREELSRVDAFLSEDERAQEIRNLPSGSIVTGTLAEFDADVGVVRRVLDAATLSAERRVPLIVEG